MMLRWWWRIGMMMVALTLCLGQNCEVTVLPSDEDPDDGMNDDSGQGVPELDDLVFSFTPDDLMLACDDPTNADQLDAWLASPLAETDPTCEPITIEHDFIGAFDACEDDWTVLVTWTATDACDRVITTTALLTITDPGEPIVTLVGAEELTLECGVETYVEQGATVDLGCGDLILDAVIGGDVVDTGTVGTYTVTYDPGACDDAAELLTRTVEVVDTLPPEIMVSDPIELWPSNGKYRDFTLADCVSLIDACEGELDANLYGRILSITSDEPENSNGDGNTENDIVISSDTSFSLRVERLGGGNGRVYTVNFEIEDPVTGELIEDACLLYVPHDQSGEEPVDDGPTYEVFPPSEG